MENNNGDNGDNGGDSKLIGRRRTLKFFGAAGATGLFGFVVACKDKSTAGGDGKPTTVALGCDTPLDDTSKTMRKTLQYKKEATDPQKHCSACAQFEAAKFGECGGCKLFGGPVRPNGGCLSFAPLEGGAAVPTPQ